MHRIRNIVAAALGSAVLVSTAVGTVAADPTDFLAVVHGLPGVKAELCIDGKEVKRRFRFGQKYIFQPTAGAFNVVLKKQAPGKCKGRRLAKYRFSTGADGHKTIVASKRKGKPDFRVFDNLNAFGDAAADARPAPVLAAAILMHAAKTGPVDAFVAGVFELTGPNPTFGGMRKGDIRALLTPPGYLSVWATKGGTLKSVANHQDKEAIVDMFNYHVLVGTKPGNFRWVFFRSGAFSS